MPWDKRLHSKEIVVPYDELDLHLQKLIGDPKLSSFMSLGKSLSETRNSRSIKTERTLRGLMELQTLAYGTHAIITKGRDSFDKAIIPISILLRTNFARQVQKKHLELADAMRKHGIIQTRFENKYPIEWINPTIVAETHPIFYVDRKGNAHFLKESRAEYARYSYQKAWAGKMGLNMWRWRAYLRKPEAPESVKQWAQKKAKQWAKQLKPSTQYAYAVTKQQAVTHQRRSIKKTR